MANAMKNQVATNTRRWERKHEIRRRVEDGFDAHKVWPSARTRAAASVLERHLMSGQSGVSRAEIQSQLDDIYAGRAAARVLNGHDVVLRLYKEIKS